MEAPEPIQYQQLNGVECTVRDWDRMLSFFQGAEVGRGLVFVAHGRDVENLMIALERPGGVRLRIQAPEIDHDEISELFGRYQIWVEARLPGEWQRPEPRHRETAVQRIDREFFGQLEAVRARIGRLVSPLTRRLRGFRKSESPEK